MTLNISNKHLLGLALSFTIIVGNLNAQVDEWTWNTSTLAPFALQNGAVVDGDHVDATRNSKLWLASPSANPGDFTLTARYKLNNFHALGGSCEVKLNFGGGNAPGGGNLIMTHNANGDFRAWHSGGTGNNYNIFTANGSDRPSTTDGYMFEYTIKFDSDTSTMSIAYTVDDGDPVLVFSGPAISDSVAGFGTGTPADMITRWMALEVWQSQSSYDTSPADVEIHSISLASADWSYGGTAYVAPADPWVIDNPSDAAVYTTFSEDFTVAYDEDSSTYALSGYTLQDTDTGTVLFVDLESGDDDTTRNTDYPQDGQTQAKWAQNIQVTELITTPEETATGDNPGTTGNVQDADSDYSLTQEDIDAGEATVGGVSYVVPNTAVVGDTLEATESDSHSYVSVAEVREEVIGDYKLSYSFTFTEFFDPNSKCDVKLTSGGDGGFIQVVINSWGNTRVYHANSEVSGVNGDVVSNVNLGAVDGDEVTIELIYLASDQAFGVTGSVNGGTPVVIYGGVGNGGFTPDPISNYVEFVTENYGGNPADIPQITLNSVSLVTDFDRTTDSDGDGLTDTVELTIPTSLDSDDTDGDGLTDFEEFMTIGSDPNVDDTELINYLNDQNTGSVDPSIIPDGSVSLAANGDDFDMVLSIEQSADMVTFETMDIASSDVYVNETDNTVTITIDGSSDKAFFRTSGQ